MSGYVRDIVVKKQFEGDTVTVVLGPIKFGDVLKFGELDTEHLTQAQITPFLGVLKGYVKTFTGLKTHDAADVTVDEFFESAYFIDILTDVFADWLKQGMPQNPSSPGASPSG